MDELLNQYHIDQAMKQMQDQEKANAAHQSQQAYGSLNPDKNPYAAEQAFYE